MDHCLLPGTLDRDGALCHGPGDHICTTEGLKWVTCRKLSVYYGSPDCFRAQTEVKTVGLERALRVWGWSRSSAAASLSIREKFLIVVVHG